jgi:NAD+ kinase
LLKVSLLTRLIRNLAPIAQHTKMKIALFGKNFDKQRIPFVQKMVETLLYSKVELVIYKPYYDLVSPFIEFPKSIQFFHSNDDIGKDIAMLFSIGGDGTLLDVLPIIRETGIPVLGINMGRLGFLSSVSKQDIQQAIAYILEGRYNLINRTLLQLESPVGLFGDLNFALNELTIFRKELTSLIVINVYIDEAFVNAYWADGLIIATPTGSTAYSLSAGGPILVPTAQNFVITPIATHNLSVRPIVIPDKSIIRLKVVGRHAKYTVSMDSRSTVINQSVDIVIKKADFGVKLVNMEGKDFFGTIREKLLWGLDIRN